MRPDGALAVAAAAPAPRLRVLGAPPLRTADIALFCGERSVAPGYASTPALERVLAGRFEWWAGLLGLQRGGGRRTLAPVLALGRRTAPRRALSPALVRALARLGGPLLRLDLHPADLDHPRHVLALEAALRAARPRTAVTYDEVAAAPVSGRRA